jgi:hypothetical protein
MKKLFYGFGSLFVVTTAITVTNVFNTTAQGGVKTPMTNCYCNIGGYCETGGNLSLCAYVITGSGTSGYYCGAASGNCPTQSGPSNPTNPGGPLPPVIVPVKP